MDAYARSRDPRVKQVIVSIAAVMDTILVASSDGTLAADVRPLVRLSVQVIAEQNGRREQGHAGGGGRYGYRELMENGRALAFADEAVRQALVNLDAVDAPAGSMLAHLSALLGTLVTGAWFGIGCLDRKSTRLNSSH